MYKQKYLKYKCKYIELQLIKQKGGDIPVIQTEEFYELLPDYNEEFINIILNIHDSYTNHYGTDKGWFDFIFKFVKNVIKNKINKYDKVVEWVINEIPEDTWGKKPFKQIKNAILKTYNEVDKNMDKLKSMIINIDAITLTILKKHGLVS